MKLINLLESDITDENKSSFENIYNRINSAVKGATGVNISKKWIAGFLNQARDFKYLDKKVSAFKENGKLQEAKDAEARLIARNELKKLGLIDKTYSLDKKYMQFISQMKKYYTDPIHELNNINDIQKSTRIAGDQESQEWINSLSEKEQNYIFNIQEMEPEEFSEFKGIIKLKENKKQFINRLYDWLANNEIAGHLFVKMNFINENGDINISEIEEFREFLNKLSPSRLKDILSKSMIYTGKKITHDFHRAKNSVLKSMEKSSFGIYSKALKVYNFISRRIKDSNNSREAFKSLLNKLPMTKDSDGNLNKIGKSALLLFNNFKGQIISKESKDKAIEELNKAYSNPASSERRAAKAQTRGETMDDLYDI